MKATFKSFWGETFMLIPNINWWSDDDPDYAPHKYMLFFGWLFWGWRIYLGKREEKVTAQPHFEVVSIHNLFKDKTLYAIRTVVWPIEYAGRFTLDCTYGIARYNEGQYTFLGNNRIALTEEMRAAIRHSFELGTVVQKLYEYPILVWDSEEEADIICDHLNLEYECAKKDRWILKETT